jgi:tetratricopeptide (TPR) repeat protein
LHRRFPWIAVLLVAASARGAAADEFTYPVSSDCVATPESDDARRAIAAYWFEQGRAQVDRAAYDEAQRSFACSQAIIPHPSTLYNMGRAAEWAGDFGTALRAFEEYIETSPDAPNRNEVARLIEEVRAAHGSDPDPNQLSRRPEEADAQAIAGWVSVGLAVAAGTAAVVCGGFAGYEQARIDDPPDGTRRDRIAEWEETRDDYYVGMGVSLGVAAAAAVAGTLLLVLDGDDAAPVEVGPLVGDGAAGLIVVARF